MSIRSRLLRLCFCLFPAYSDVSFGLGHARQLLGCESYVFTLVATLPVPFLERPVHGLSVTHVGVYSEPLSVLGLVGFATVRHMHLIAIRCSTGYRRLLVQTTRQTMRCSSWRVWRVAHCLLVSYVGVRSVGTASRSIVALWLSVYWSVFLPCSVSVPRFTCI